MAATSIATIISALEAISTAVTIGGKITDEVQKQIDKHYSLVGDLAKQYQSHSLAIQVLNKTGYKLEKVDEYGDCQISGEFQYSPSRVIEPNKMAAFSLTGTGLSNSLIGYRIWRVGDIADVAMGWWLDWSRAIWSDPYVLTAIGEKDKFKPTLAGLSDYLKGALSPARPGYPPTPPCKMTSYDAGPFKGISVHGDIAHVTPEHYKFRFEIVKES